MSLNDTGILNKANIDTILDWPYPIALASVQTESTPYPLYALPAVIQNTVKQYHDYGKQPLPLIACSALANISLACQALANVARDTYLKSPVSLYFLMVAGSGERKSAADTIFSKATRQWEEDFRQKREIEAQTASALYHAWQMERDGLLSQIKKAALAGSNADFLKIQFAFLMEQEPEIPLLPTLYFEDATYEALAANLANHWPSASLWSDEAGVVLGSHSMQSNPTRFVALLNRLWDGKAFTAHRKTSQNFTIQHRRLTLNLMMQPQLFNNMVHKSNDISRQSGFMARCLIAYPISSMGKRFYQEPPDNIIGLEDYEARLEDCLDQTKHLTKAGCCDLPTLQMNTAAKKLWISFFNQIEAGLSSNGQWLDIRDFASKACENVARLAALFHLFEGKEGDIDAESMEQAIAIIQWHLQEVRRLFSPQDISNNLASAQKLLNWLKNKGDQTISLRDIQRLSPIRDRSILDEAVAILIKHHCVRLQKIAGKTVLELSPYFA